MRRTVTQAGSAMLLACAPLCVLGACSAEPDSPGAITADEQRQLNEAAEMLDANSVSADLFEDDNGSIPGD